MSALDPLLLTLWLAPHLHGDCPSATIDCAHGENVGSECARAQDTRDPSQGPRDPALAAAFDSLLLEIGATSLLSDDRSIEEIEAGLRDLDARLQGAERVWAGELWLRWGRHSLGALERLTEAERAFGLAAEIFRHSGDEARLAELALARASVLTALTRYPEALAGLDLAETIFAREGNERQLAAVAVERAVVLCEQGHYPEALEQARHAAVLTSRSAQTELEAEVQLVIGHVWANSSRFDDALVAYDRAAVLLAQHPEARRARLSVHLGRGVVRLQLGRIVGAREDFEDAQALVGAPSPANAVARAALAQNLGQILWRQGDFEGALIQYDQGEMSYDEAGDVRGAAKVALDRGIVFRSQGRFDEALEEIDRGASRWREAGTEQGLGRFELNRAAVLDDQARFDEALATYDLAAELLGREGDEIALSVVEENRGHVLYRCERPGEALEAFIDSAERLERILSEEVASLGEESSLSLRSLSQTLLSGALDAAFALEEGGDMVLAPAYRVAQLFHGLGLLDCLTQRSGPGTVDVPRDLRDGFQEARSALDAAQDKRALLRRQTPANTLEERNELANELAAVEDAIEELDRRCERIDEAIRIRRLQTTAAVHVAPASLAEIQAVLPHDAALLEFSADVHDFAHSVYAFVITRDSSHLLALGDPTEIAALIKAGVAQLQDDASSTTTDRERAALRSLGQRLLDPCLAALDGIESIGTLIISPDGELCRIPFEALLLEDPAEDAPRQRWPFAIQRYRIVYVHSGSVLRELCRRDPRQPGGRDFVAFAHPLYERSVPAAASSALEVDAPGRLPSVVSTARAALRAARLFASTGAEVASLDAALVRLEIDPEAGELGELTGEDFRVQLHATANEAALKCLADVRRARILHLGCHGYGDLETPALSHLVLAQSDRLADETGEDGYVYPRELCELELDAELVVLAACETNAGRLRPFEGISGLARAAIVAGARSVLSTLWTVPGRSSADFLVDFYQLWCAERFPKVEALARAKQRAIARGVPSKTWAGFVLWGRADE